MIGVEPGVSPILLLSSRVQGLGLRVSKAVNAGRLNCQHIAEVGQRGGKKDGCFLRSHRSFHK